MTRLPIIRSLVPTILLPAFLLAGCSVAEFMKPPPPGPIQLDQKNYQSALGGQRSSETVSEPETQAPSQSAALYSLATRHEQGLGVEKNLTMAYYLYLSAAEQNDIGAQIKVGEMLLRGDGIAPDNVEGVKWYFIAALNNSQRGQALVTTELPPIPPYDRDRAEALANAWHQVRAERIAHPPAPR